MAATEREELASIACDLRGHIEWLREAGAVDLPRPVPVAVPPAAARPPAGDAVGSADAPGTPRGPGLLDFVRAQVGATRTPPPAPRAPEPAPVHRAPATSPASPAAVQAPAVARPATSATPVAAPRVPRTLEQIRAEIGDCRRCKLAGGRTTLVYGVGNPRAELVFVGEGPGADEDAQGIPFVGKAGQLLTKMIEAMGFGRDDVYICNVVKCRPPGNRNPEPDEIEACEPFLKAQLASLQPKVIVALGKFAAQTLLRDATPITRLRGNWREYCGIKLMPTFHPAYLLRSPQEKAKAWDDLKLVMKEFGMEPRR